MASNKSNSTPVTNGVKSHSQTLDHFVSYPVVADAIKQFESTSLGAQGISIFHSLSRTFIDPVLPYLQTPISIAEPYLHKVDELGDSTLKTVDNHFPSVKSTHLSDLRNQISAVLGYPFKLTGEAKDYVFETYNDEYKKTTSPPDGVVKSAKVLVSTELRIVSEGMHYIADMVGPSKEKAEKTLEDWRKTAEETVAEFQGKTKEGAKDLQKKGEEGAKELQKKGEEGAKELQKKGEVKTQQVNGQVQQVKA